VSVCDTVTVALPMFEHQVEDAIRDLDGYAIAA
jgi:hypothetical protein